MTPQNLKLPPTFLTAIPWNPDPFAIAIASSLILKRNLARYNFPAKLQSLEMQQVLDKLQGTLLTLKELENPQFVLIKNLNSVQKDLILEHFLFLHGFQDIPPNSGMVFDQKGLFLAAINEGNHLEMRVLNFNEALEGTWNFLSKIESTLSKNNEFAFSSKFGYLTSDPSQSGTGLIARIYLHLPACIHMHQLESVLEKNKEDAVEFMGLSGDLNDLIGDIIVLENNFSLGMTEEAILHSLQSTAYKLISAEKIMRQHLLKEKNIEITDLISKAFGLIVHGCQLETKEALDLLSLMKLGLYLEMIEGVAEEKLNALFFACRRGYLSHVMPEVKDQKELAVKRAEHLHQELKSLALKS